MHDSAPVLSPYKEGYAAGLASPGNMSSPYDGRTKAGKLWWQGFMAGDAKRCADKRLETGKPEVL